MQCDVVATYSSFSPSLSFFQPRYKWPAQLTEDLLKSLITTWKALQLSGITKSHRPTVKQQKECLEALRCPLSNSFQESLLNLQLYPPLQPKSKCMSVVTLNLSCPTDSLPCFPSFWSCFIVQFCTAKSSLEPLFFMLQNSTSHDNTECISDHKSLKTYKIGLFWLFEKLNPKNMKNLSKAATPKCLIYTAAWKNTG